jgi:hypothetical protein
VHRGRSAQHWSTPYINKAINNLQDTPNILLQHLTPFTAFDAIVHHLLLLLLLLLLLRLQR